jgi:hypothetical protein
MTLEEKPPRGETIRAFQLMEQFSKMENGFTSVKLSIQYLYFHIDGVLEG